MAKLLPNIAKLGDKTPLWGDVITAYDLSKEHIQEQNYKIELAGVVKI